MSNSGGSMTADEHEKGKAHTDQRLPRRRMLGLTGGAGAALLGAVLLPHEGGRAAGAQGNEPLEPGAGTWHTWVLRSGDQLRPPPPPDGAATAAKAAELRARAARRTPETLDRIRFWDTGAPGYRWNEAMLALTGRSGILPSRHGALLNVAIADATIAAWDAKYTYNRRRPATVEPAVATALPTPASPSYPCEHAVTAGAAAAVLSYLFPDDSPSLPAQAEEAAQSRVDAGLSFPSDVRAGLDLGRAVAALVIERARGDGSAAPWMGMIPGGPGMWSLAGYPDGTVPALPTAGTWKTWALDSGSQFRPSPPPAVGSERLTADLAEIKEFRRTFATNQAAYFWHPFPFPRWMAILNQKLFEERLDTNPPRAARAYALASVAEFDAVVACWNAKYTYWQIRPFQLDPGVTTLFQTPAHPSYPAGHGTADAAWEVVLTALFPRDAAFFTARAEEAANSRVWAGIHYRIDIEVGLELGRTVGRAVLARAGSI
jgi:membrane-associated phospholipid phosphatase